MPNSYECVCTVCDNKVMTRGAKDHLLSQGHWILGLVEVCKNVGNVLQCDRILAMIMRKNLWDKMQKLNRDLPPDNVRVLLQGS